MKFFTDVVTFNEQLLGIPRGRLFKVFDVEMWVHLNKCLTEEIDELAVATAEKNFIGSVDALTDLMYFAVGGLHKLGLTPQDMQACCDVVHQANMRKKGGVIARRGDGTIPDAVKPDDWESPEQGILQVLKYAQFTMSNTPREQDPKLFKQQPLGSWGAGIPAREDVVSAQREANTICRELIDKKGE
jgi:phosphoribosyl-ATP pyrophosphohydrolase